MPATKRIKPAGLASKEAFLATIDKIAELSTEKKKLEVKRDQKIQAIQDEYSEDLMDMDEELKSLLSQAEAYAEKNRDEVIPTGKQTAETELATYGFRVHPDSLVLLNKSHTWETVATALERAYGDRYVETVLTVKKDEVKANLTDAEMAAVGTRLKKTESFGVTPKLSNADTLKS